MKVALFLLYCLLIVMKMAGFVTLSWLIVLAPLWLGPLAVVVLSIITVLSAFLFVLAVVFLMIIAAILLVLFGDKEYKGTYQEQFIDKAGQLRRKVWKFSNHV